MTQKTDTLKMQIQTISLDVHRDKRQIITDIIRAASKFGYEVVDIDVDKPWGAFVRFDTKSAGDFLGSFFPDVDSKEIRLGRDDVELSPKFLLVLPNTRLSWQRHTRRAERWAYLTEGGYHRSPDPDNQGDVIIARVGDSVQFEAGECHRLVGGNGDQYTLVAEVWQHTDPNIPSDEGDIERLADDYRREN